MSSYDPPPGTAGFSASGPSMSKIWRGSTTTTAGGSWTIDYSSAGFAAAPFVKAQAISVGATPNDAVLASVTTPTNTSVSGFVVRPSSTTVSTLGSTVNPFSMGNAGITVQVTAVGS